MSSSTDNCYRCPGESYPIARAIHLGRLAAGFPACRGCEHRFDTAVPPAPPSSNNVEVEVAPAPEAYATGSWQWSPEGPLGAAASEVDPPRVRRFATALGTVLRSTGDTTPGVAVAADGRWLTAPLLAAARDGLLLAGCRVVESGASTAGSLALVVHRHGLDGGLLIGNASGTAQGVSLKCWGAGAAPWSSGGRLDEVARVLASPGGRPSRRGGGIARIDLGAEYRAELAELFHGLRPLRFVLDTASQPLVEHLQALAAPSACRVVAPRTPAMGELAPPTGRKTALQRHAPAVRPGAVAAAAAFRARRVERLRQQVVDERLDFALWIDGDGDGCELMDDQGLPVRGERLLTAFAERLSTDAKPRGVLVEADTLPAAKARLAKAGIPCHAIPAGREAMFAALSRSGAPLGGGPSGRIWFNSSFPQCDAPRTLGELLQLLSDSDRPLSEALAGKG